MLLKTLLAALFLANASCQNTTNPNEAFERKYKKQVEKMNIDRAPSETIKKEVMRSSPPTTEELNAINPEVPIENYYAYVDVSKFYDDSPRKKFYEASPEQMSPTLETYEIGKERNPDKMIPGRIFEVSYNTELYSRFRKLGYEFDRIRIPSRDAYGVKTSLSDKTYTLVGNDTLQKNIGKINAERGRDDIEISMILISEQKSINQKNRMLRDFGEEADEKISVMEKAAKQAPKKPAKISTSKKKTEIKSAQNSPQNVTPVIPPQDNNSKVVSN